MKALSRSSLTAMRNTAAIILFHHHEAAIPAECRPVRMSYQQASAMAAQNSAEDSAQDLAMRNPSSASRSSSCRR
jgi:hypothetical protein